MKVILSRIISTAFTSHSLRNLRRRVHALRRIMRGGKPTVHYFHQADDPYSQIAVQVLARFAQRYKVELVCHLVAPPDDAAAPERYLLRQYALRDGYRLAREYGFVFSEHAVEPDAQLLALGNAIIAKALTDERFKEVAPLVGRAFWDHDLTGLNALAATMGRASDSETLATIEQGTKARKALGHYLSAMFYFEGEWYWGIDRLHHLERRLREMGLDRSPDMPGLAPYRDLKLGSVPQTANKPVIEAWFSFRSPYSYLFFPRIRKLARHYGADLKLRFILPMVMRGLPVPIEKRLYIVLDAKREADMVGMRYGTSVDPVGPGAARALAVLHHAVKLGKGEDFAELGMQAAFADGIALASDSGLYGVGKRAGLTKAQVKAALADDSWQSEVEANRQALFDAGLWGAPTFRVNGMAAHWGQDRLWALEEDLLQAMGANTAAAE